jgi:hypothetical protein
MPDVVLRPAEAEDAHDIARILRAALAAFNWMPQLHTPDEDLYLVRHVLLAEQTVHRRYDRGQDCRLCRHQE